MRFAPKQQLITSRARCPASVTRHSAPLLTPWPPGTVTSRRRKLWGAAMCLLLPLPGVWIWLQFNPPGSRAGWAPLPSLHMAGTDRRGSRECCATRGVRRDEGRPGEAPEGASRRALNSPWQNGIVESFNGRLRDPLLSSEIFDTLAEARYLIDRWRLFYNHRRIQRALGKATPAAFAATCPALPLGRCTIS